MTTPLSLSALLRGPLSSDRFTAYHISSDRDALDATARYLWNMALGEALYPTLQALEVALRNTLYDELSVLFGPTWLDQPAVLVDAWGRRQVNEAKATLSRFHKPHTAGRIVAELKFGFWTHLFNVNYERPIWQKLWSRSNTFPYLPRRQRKAKVLRTRFNNIRDLRNRVFHHEPIWYRQDLKQMHGDILEAIGWISPVMRDTAQILDRFPAIHQAGAQLFRPGLEGLCQQNGYTP